MMPKIATGMVIIRSLFIVVVRESSAKRSQTDKDALGDSKKVNKAQLIQAAFPNMVTLELRSSRRYLVKLFLVTPVENLRIFNSARLYPEARNKATEMTQSKNQTDR